MNTKPPKNNILDSVHLTLPEEMITSVLLCASQIKIHKSTEKSQGGENDT